MNAQLEFRVDALERQVALLTGQLATRDALAGSPGSVADGVVEPPATMTRHVPFVGLDGPLRPMPRSQHLLPVENYPPPASSRRKKGPRDLEDLLGGRLLGLVGGLSVLIGIAFFVALAIDHGWIGETARVALAGGGSVALFAGGVWLYEHRGRSQAALAMVGSAIAGLFLTLAAATALYELVPLPAALPFAFGIGVVATAVAVRWDTRTVAALGIGGTLLVPVLGNSLTTAGMAFLAVAAASAAGVLVWRRWPWLAVGASALTLAQVSVWAVDEVPAAPALVGVLTVFAALNLALALGFELRSAAATLEPCSALLVPSGALILGALGYFGLPHGPGDLGGGLWLVSLALAHAALAGLAFGLRRVSNEIGLVILGAAVVLGDVAFGLLADGWVLGVGWAASAAALAAAARLYTGRAELIQLTLGGQLALSVAHVLLFDAQPQLLVDGGGPGPGPLAALTAVLVASFASARLLVDERGAVRTTLDGLTMAALAYATAVSLDGTPLLLAWAVAAVALARAADRFDDRVAGFGALGFVALLAGHVLTFEAPPSALVYGLDSPATAALGIVLVAACAAVCARVDPTRTVDERTALGALAAVALLYLGSTEIVSLFQPGGADAQPDDPMADRHRYGGRRTPAGAGSPVGVLGVVRLRGPLGRPARQLEDRPAGRARPALPGHRQGVPVRPVNARLGLSRRLVHRPGAAAAHRGVRAPADARRELAAPRDGAAAPRLPGVREWPDEVRRGRRRTRRRGCPGAVPPRRLCRPSAGRCG